MLKLFSTIKISVLCLLFLHFSLFAETNEEGHFSTLETFGSFLPNNLQKYCTYNLLIPSTKNTPLLQDSEKSLIIFASPQNDGLLPSSFGQGDLLVTFDKKTNTSSYYSSLTLNPDIYSHPEKMNLVKDELIGYSKLQKLLNKYIVAYSEIKNHQFVLPKKHLYKEESPKIVITHIGFQAGIYTKFINALVKKTVVLPFRKSFDLRVDAYQERTINYYLQPALKIEVKIKSSEGKVVFQNTILYNSIILNKLNNLILPKDLYQMHWSKPYIFIGKWTEKKRSQIYTLQITTTNRSLKVSRTSVDIHFH